MLPVVANDFCPNLNMSFGGNNKWEKNFPAESGLNWWRFFMFNCQRDIPSCDTVLTRSLLLNMTSTASGRNSRVWATSCQSSRCLCSTVLPWLW